MGNIIVETQEKWVNSAFGVVTDTNENCVAVFQNNPVMGVEALLNSRRAVECHNALLGIPSPAETLKQVRHLLEDISSGTTHSRGRGGQGISSLSQENMMQWAAKALSLLEGKNL
jgi:hypothetical protein